MASVVVAWLAGQGIIWYRHIHDKGGPPMPGQLLASSALYAALALAADNETSRPLAQAGAWGFTIAAFLALYNKPERTGGTRHAPPGAKVAPDRPAGTPPAGNPIRNV